MTNLGKTVAAVVLILGIVSLALGVFFIQQGTSKAELITEKMAEQNITYTAAGGSIQGAIDTPQEAQAMVNVLEEHSKAMGNYAQLKRDDPNRQQILNAMTMTNALNMAIMGFGLTDVVKASGAFMIITGLAFGIVSTSVLMKKKQD